MHKIKFYPASKKPTLDCEGKTALLYNPCDGYHLAERICFNENGEFEGFYPFLGKRFSEDFYILWAILPEIAES